MVRPLALVSCIAVALLCSSCGGGKRAVVPDVRGKSSKQAFAVLMKRHLCPSTRSAVWSTAEKERSGTVVDQDPTPGERVARNSSVTLWVREPETLEKGKAEIKVTFGDAAC